MYAGQKFFWGGATAPQSIGGKIGGEAPRPPPGPPDRLWTGHVCGAIEKLMETYTL